MTSARVATVGKIDRLVVSDDAVAARLWPRLGPRVRAAYISDRDGWVVLRRTVEAGATLSNSTLVAQHKVFSGWARAFRAVAVGRRKGTSGGIASRTSAPPSPTSAVTSAPMANAAAASPLALASPQAMPALAAVSTARGGAGTAVAGGLVLAGLIAFAARRKRS